MMNYFELYQIPVSLNVDQEVVRQKYYQLSKEYHPDFYISESDDKQAEVLELSTLNTKAYDTFQDENKLISYILKVYGVYEESNNEKLPQAFLMEMMDLNEKLMELEFDPDESVVKEVESELATNQKELLKIITPFPEDLSELTDEEREKELKKLKDYYLKRKYLLRIQERLNKFAPR